MNAVEIDVSKGKSTVAVLRPFGEVVAEPFDVIHNDNDLKNLVPFIKKLSGESKVVMEATFVQSQEFISGVPKNIILLISRQKEKPLNLMVKRFSMWHARRDSNPRPSGS